MLLHSVIGGTVVTAVSYFGSHGKGFVAAFLAFLPSISVVSLCVIYLSSGTGAAVSYAKDMLILLPSWILYVIGLIFLLPRLGLTGATAISVATYAVTAFLIMKLV